MGRTVAGVNRAFDDYDVECVEVWRQQDALAFMQANRRLRQQVLGHVRGLETELNRPLTWRERLTGRRRLE